MNVRRQYRYRAEIEAWTAANHAAADDYHARMNALSRCGTCGTHYPKGDHCPCKETA